MSVPLSTLYLRILFIVCVRLLSAKCTTQIFMVFYFKIEQLYPLTIRFFFRKHDFYILYFKLLCLCEFKGFD